MDVREFSGTTTMWRIQSSLPVANATDWHVER